MYIYKVTNVVNTKIYIGLSTHLIENSVDYLGSGILINKAISKYGRENFIKEILENNIDSISLLNEREIFWIKEFNSTDKTIGYNISHGGAGSLGVEKSLETREKLRNANLGKVQEESTILKRSSKIKGMKRTDESKTNISEGLKKYYSEFPHHMLGKENKHSDETKLKISESHKGKILSDEHKQKISESNKGRHRNIVSLETREKLSKSHLGKTVSKETKNKMSESHKKPQSKIQCDRCGKVGGNSMRRWHFENCKK